MTEAPEGANYDRQDDVTYLVTLASRLTDKDHPRGIPKGFVILIMEGDGTFTHRVADPDNNVEWTAVLGGIEVIKNALINTKFSWEPVHKDGREFTEDELNEFWEELGKEEGEDGE